MKTLESIINSPERILSNEEMKSLRGGDATCKCAYWIGEEIEAFQSVQVEGGDCGSASFELSQYYTGFFDFVHCY